jgi:hypothetical protein
MYETILNRSLLDKLYKLHIGKTKIMHIDKYDNTLLIKLI